MYYNSENFKSFYYNAIPFFFNNRFPPIRSGKNGATVQLGSKGLGRKVRT